jgi:hypothetical protein
VLDLRGDRAARRRGAPAPPRRSPPTAHAEAARRADRHRQPARVSGSATARRSSSRSRARAEAEAAGRLDLRLRALGVEGMARAKHGEYQAGLETCARRSRSALEHD